MVDRLTDKNCWEILGIVGRFVTSSGEIKEHALDLKCTENRSAVDLLAVLWQSLADEEISTYGIVDQCYDGANVMSGEL